MASLVVAGDVSGSVTLSAPSAAGSTVITLPTTSGTMVVTGGAQTVQFAAGSAALPSITFTGDTNTGIFSPTADTIGFSEGGVESMRIDSSGNVGIGTSSPSAKVQIFKTAVGASSSTVTPANTALGLQYDSSTVYGYHYMNADGVYFIDARTNGVAGGNICLWGQNSVQFRTAGVDSDTARMIINSSGNVGIGTATPGSQKLHVRATSPTEPMVRAISVTPTGNGVYGQYNAKYDGTASDWYFGQGSTGAWSFWNNDGSVNERMRITSGGALLVGTTSAALGDDGLKYEGANGALLITRSSSTPFAINRRTNDGNLLEFYQDTVQEGNISVSGTTVSYNGGHLARWSQLPSNQKDDTLLKGTVMSNLDDMCVWTKDGEVLPNEQLNKMKVSDVEGDTNVAGVFVDWQYDEQCQSDDMNVAMTGDMIIRIAEGVVVQKGDLLMSAGDGTAKPQGDDIRRSKTVAKVTSNHVTCTYEDGSYCVPCVLMAC